MGTVINLRPESWNTGVFNEAGLRVDVSSRGNVRLAAEAPTSSVLTLAQVVRLIEALSAGQSAPNESSALQEEWKEVITLDSESTSMQVYVNDQTGEAEIVQMNDDGDAIRTTLGSTDAQLLASALTCRLRKVSL